MNGNQVENIIMRKNAAGTPADSGAANATPKNAQNEQKSSSIFAPKQGMDFSKIFSNNIIIGVQIFILVLVAALFVGVKILAKKRKAKEYERSLKLIPLLIHLPPATDDIQGGGRDERDVNEEAISQSTIMYSIIASTLKKESFNTKLYGQKYFSFEMVVVDGLVKYYAVVPAVTTEIVKQAIQSSYPTARLEEAEVENIFSNAGLGDEAKEDEDSRNVAGGELIFKKEEYYPIQVFSESKWDAQLAILNAFAKAKKGEGLVDLRDFICDDSSVRGLAMTIFLSRNSSFIANSSMDNAPMPLMSGKILESIIFNCIAGDNQISNGIAELNIYNKSEAIKNSKKFEGATFEPLSITWITAKSDYPIDVLFKNCLFKGQKNDIELEHLNFKAISSEFNDTYIEARGKLGKNDEAKMGNLSLENSIFSGHNEICAIEDSKISSSTIKDTFLSGVSLVENSSMDKFKSMKDVYRDFNSDVKIEPAPKEVGVINNEIEVL